MNKILYIFLFFFILFFSIVLILRVPDSQIHSFPDRVSLVDTGHDLCNYLHAPHCKQNRNLLVRGSRPIELGNNNTTAQTFRQALISELSQQLRSFPPEKLKQLGLDGPNEILKSYRIVVVNLIYGKIRKGEVQFDRQQLYEEFGKLSSLSKTIELPVMGKVYGLNTTFNPNDDAYVWHPIILTESNLHRLSSLVKPSGELVQLLLDEPSDGRPLLIFYHCAAGRDRTGIVTMSYFMNYGGYPFLTKNRAHPMKYVDAVMSSFVHPFATPNTASIKLAYTYCKTLPGASGLCGNSKAEKIKVLVRKGIFLIEFYLKNNDIARFFSQRTKTSDVD